MKWNEGSGVVANRDHSEISKVHDETATLTHYVSSTLRNPQRQPLATTTTINKKIELDGLMLR